MINSSYYFLNLLKMGSAYFQYLSRECLTPCNVIIGGSRRQEIEPQNSTCTETKQPFYDCLIFIFLRYSLGDTSTDFLNIWEKYEGEENPIISEICDIE